MLNMTEECSIRKKFVNISEVFTTIKYFIERWIWFISDIGWHFVVVRVWQRFFKINVQSYISMVSWSIDSDIAMYHAGETYGSRQILDIPWKLVS